MNLAQHSAAVLPQVAIFRSPIGKLYMTEQDGRLTNLSFAPIEGPLYPADQLPPVLQQAYDELAEYFAGVRKSFEVPLCPAGTAFQKRVWNCLCHIPYGTICSYKELAQAAGNAKAARAVGMANHRNPIVIMIPCHRVIGANGTLTGYGAGIEKKEYLLKLEKEHCL